LSGLVGRSRVILPPLDDLLDDVAYPSLFCASALLLAFSRRLRLLVLTGLFSLVLNVADCILSIHQSIDAHQSEIFCLDVEKSIKINFFEIDGDILADGEYSAGDEDLSI
jgi:hypothetical protein